MKLNVKDKFKKEDVYFTSISKVGHCPAFVFAEKLGDGLYRSITTGEEYESNLDFDNKKDFICSYSLREGVFTTLKTLSENGHRTDVSIIASDGKREEEFKLYIYGTGALFNLPSANFSGIDLSEVMDVKDGESLTRLQIAQIEWYTNRYLQNSFSSSGPKFQSMNYRNCFFPPFGDETRDYHNDEFPTADRLYLENTQIEEHYRPEYLMEQGVMPKEN